MTVSPEEQDLELRVQSAVAALRKLGASEVYLLGSLVQGTRRSHSDLDLAVSGLPPHLFYRAMSEASVAAGVPVDLVDLDRPTPLTRYIMQKEPVRRVG